MNRPSLRVLALDTDPVDLELLRRYLGEIPDWELTFWPFTSVDAALDALAEKPVDVILLDYHLGAENAPRVIRMVRELGTTCPIIVVSGRGDEEIAAAVLTAGAADYMPKSVLSVASLQRSISNVVERHRMATVIDEHVRHLRRVNQQLQAERAESNALIDALAVEMARPLGRVRDALSGLLRGSGLDLDEAQVKGLSDALDGCRELGSLVGDLVDTVRLDRGRMTLARAPVNLFDIVDGELRALAGRLERAGVTLAAVLDSTRAIVPVDASRMRQAVRTMLVHAIESTPRGGEVRVELAPGDPMVTLSVFNSASWTTEEVEALFERVGKGRSGGVTLGLRMHLCRELVRLHGGELVAVGDDTGGRLTVELPVVESAATTV